MLYCTQWRYVSPTPKMYSRVERNSRVGVHIPKLSTRLLQEAQEKYYKLLLTCKLMVIKTACTLLKN